MSLLFNTTKSIRTDETLHDGSIYTVIKEYFDNGSIYAEHHYINEIRHRDNAPTHIYYRRDGTILTEFYYKNGKKHREDGPAYIYMMGTTDEGCHYFLNDVMYCDKDITDNWIAFCKLQIFQ